MITVKDQARIQHILDSIGLLQQYLNSIDEADFLSNVEKQDSVIRRLEVIGEAARGISEELKDSSPHIAWRKAAALRNVLIHEYFDVDLSSVWVTATEYIPELKEELEELA